MKIVTGYKGEPHITSAQDRAWHQGIFGTGSYVLNIGQKLAGEIVTANEIRIMDGAISHQGCIAVIGHGTYDTLEIANGEQGKKRIDLVVARYSIDTETGEENLDLVVIEGTSTTGTPEAPAFTTGNIQAGDSPVDMPLYNVNIDGIAIESLTPRFSTVGSILDANNSITNLGNEKVSKSGDTMTGNLSINRVNGGELRTNNPNLDSKSGVGVPSSLQSFGGVRHYDKNGSNTYYSMSQRAADDTIYQSFVARRLLADNRELLHGFYLRIAADGTRSVTFTEANAWATGLGVVKKSGDTMTGNLNLEKTSGNTFFEAKRTDSGACAQFGVGSGGDNHGVYSVGQNRWLVHGDGTDVYIAGIKCTNAATLRSSISAAPTSHASSANTYGLGSTSNYGHVKTINGLTQSSHADGTALSAYQGKVLNDKITALTNKVVFERIKVAGIPLGTIPKLGNVTGTYTIPTSVLPSTKKAVAIAGIEQSSAFAIPNRAAINGDNTIYYKIVNWNSTTDQQNATMDVTILAVPK